MNDIYLQKANKYKYKYLKLKNNYIANLEGGCGGGRDCDLNLWHLWELQPRPLPQTPLQLQQSLKLIEKPISVKDFDNNHLYYYDYYIIIINNKMIIIIIIIIIII
jgi:hypothetical protein